MIIKSISNNQTIDGLVNVFMQYMGEDYTSYFNVYLSDDIKEDYAFFDGYLPRIDLAGTLVLPKTPKEKLIVLLSSADIDIVFHELSHVCDFVEFSKQYCNNDLSKIRTHHLYQSFLYWSEFHAKLIEIQYFQKLFDELVHDEPYGIEYFSNNISSFYYPEYTKKMLNKIKSNNCSMRDYMSYIGEIVVCNLYDKNKTYSVDKNVILDVPFLNTLYDMLKDRLDFSSYVQIASNFENLVRNIR